MFWLLSLCGGLPWWLSGKECSEEMQVERQVGYIVHGVKKVETQLSDETTTTFVAPSEIWEGYAALFIISKTWRQSKFLDE